MDPSEIQEFADRLASGTCPAGCTYCARRKATAAVVLMVVATVLAVATFPAEGAAAATLVALALVLGFAGWRVGERSGMDARAVSQMVARWPAALLLLVVSLTALIAAGFVMSVVR
jgi:hypothetical protein